MMATFKLFEDQKYGSVERVIHADSVDGHTGIGNRCSRLLGRDPNDVFNLELHPLIALSFEYVRSENGQIFSPDFPSPKATFKWTGKTIRGWRAFVAWLYAYLFMKGC